MYLIGSSAYFKDFFADNFRLTEQLQKYYRVDA